MPISTIPELTLPLGTNPLLTNLAEVGGPETISWLPNAPGWFVLLGILLCFITFRLFLRVKRYFANIYRRAALQELHCLQHLELGSSRLPQLLRRTALYAFPREEVAPLIGQDWEKWLDSHCPGSQFSTQYSGLLATLAYSGGRGLSDLKSQECFKAVRHWIQHHEVRHD
ncbi:DUF4381 domain-containing protein [Vibrio campbellii]|uniref:DUF4381 domain-containing protein n=1 Tax=Vibrio campbellii TaxID=680 RepID=UPI0012D394B8|nr:DUF4381 domain-containing protein [Vibrio campbellii]